MSASDPVFEAYVRAAEGDAGAALERVVGAALPAIRDACRAAAGIGRDDVEDAAADALAQVIARVRQLRDAGDRGDTIQNLGAYAAVAARRVCADRLRRAHPVRARLASRVRYALTHDPRLTTRRDERGTYAGLAGWSDALATVPAVTAARAAGGVHVGVDGAALLDTMRTLLERAGGWLEVGALVTVLFDAAGLREPAFAHAEDVDLPAPQLAPVDEDGPRAALTAAWSEIGSLPARQRAALLLNLRDADGRSLLPLLVAAGMATMPGLAGALDITATELDALWGSLPLDDLRIAERLGATRQQVINLRKSARARLARRLTKLSLPVVIQGTFGRQIKRGDT